MNNTLSLSQQLATGFGLLAFTMAILLLAFVARHGSLPNFFPL